MNIVGQLIIATCRLDVLTMINTKQVVHAHHNWHIAFLFERNNLKAKLQHTLVLEWHGVFGQLQHGDNTS